MPGRIQSAPSATGSVSFAADESFRQPGTTTTTTTTNIINDPTAFTALTQIHKQAVRDCCFSPDSDQILTCSEDQTVVIWNLPPNDTVLHDDTINDDHKLVCYRLSDHKDFVMAVSAHRKLFLSASRDGHVKLWKFMPSSVGPGYSHGSSRHNRALGNTTSRSNHLHQQQVFKQPNPEPITYNCHSRMVRSVTVSHDARCFATGSDDRSVKIWSTECRNKMLVSLLDGHNNWIKSVQWAKTNDFLLASCGDDGRICVWDTRTKVRQPPCEMIATKRSMQFNCLDWHPVFEHHLATGAHDSSCVVWDLRNRKQAQVYLEHNGSINSVAFDSGGSLLLSGSKDHTSKIFDVCEGRAMFTLKSHTGPVTSVCFNSTGEMFATASEDKTVTIWNRNFEVISIIPAALDETQATLDESYMTSEEHDSQADLTPSVAEFARQEHRAKTHHQTIPKTLTHDGPTRRTNSRPSGTQTTSRHVRIH